MKMYKKKVIFNDNITHTPIKDEEIKIFKKFSIVYKGRDCLCEDDIIKYAEDTNIIFNQGVVNITRKIIENLPKLEAILRRGVGYDNVDVQAAIERGICVSNTPGFCIDEVSTHAVALLLSFARRIPKWSNWVKQGKWKELGKKAYEGLESILGDTVGIIGFGNIGRETYKKLEPFGTSIYIYDPFVKIDKKYSIKRVSLSELIKKSKYIILACCLTKKTNNILNEEQFKMMRSDAVIINVARGELINEKILIKYLTKEKISGAALDVFEREPIDKDNPLLKLDNIILTPHNAAVSSKSIDLSLRMSFDEMIRIATGKKPKYRVN